MGDPMRRLLIVVAVIPFLACRSPSLADRLSAGTWIDLTYTFDSTTIYWPTAQPFHLTVVSARRLPAGYYYAANNLSAAEHGGTHVDAPVHFIEKKRTTDQIPLSQLLGPAIVIDVTRQADSSADYRLHQSDITAWEAAHGDIPPDAIVLIRTGWGAVGLTAPDTSARPRQGRLGLQTSTFRASTWMPRGRWCGGRSKPWVSIRRVSTTVSPPPTSSIAGCSRRMSPPSRMSPNSRSFPSRGHSSLRCP